MNRRFDALAQVRSVRAQLKERAARAKGAVADAIAALDKQAGELERAARSNSSACPRSEAAREFFELEPAFQRHPVVADSADAVPRSKQPLLTRTGRKLENSSIAGRRSGSRTFGLTPSWKKARLAPIDPGKSAENSRRGCGWDDVP